jgi:hypothetical protein
MSSAQLSPGQGGASHQPAHWSAPVYADIGMSLLVGVLVMVALTFRDYGITHDEAVQNEYGKMILAFYTSFFQDWSVFEYLDLYRYGGFFDLLAAIANRFSPFGVYETRHLLGGLIGIAGLAGVWRLGRFLGGERAGVLALVLLAVTPAYYGHMFNNPKDAPFAVAMVWTLLFLCRLVNEMPTPSRSALIGFGVAFGIALGIRVGAVLVIIYLGLALFLRLFGLWMRLKAIDVVLREAWTMVRHLLPAMILAYAVMAFFWPWAALSPLNPIDALTGFSHLGLKIDTLVAGKKVVANALPASYIPTYLAVNLPEIVLFGLALALLLFLIWLGRLRPRQSSLGPEAMSLMLVSLAALFPLGFFMLTKPTAYNGLRHFLFVVPPLIALAAVAMDKVGAWMWSHAHWPGRLFELALAALLVIQVWIMAQLHPNEYIYFNLLAGGVRGAEGRYEMDYWSNSLREAALELADYVERENGDAPVTRTFKVAVCGHALSAYTYFPPYLVYTKKLDEADFMILYTSSGCHRLFEGRQIISVDRFGVALSVVKDRRSLAMRGLGR